jgi:hypothetical protein
MKTLTSILLALSIGAIDAPAVARAATTIFDVSGTAVAFAGQSCGGSCPFSGTLTIDVTTGVATAVDITLPGLSAFDTLVFSGQPLLPLPYSVWQIIAGNAASDLAILSFRDIPEPASGESIWGGGAQSSGNDTLYLIDGGSITAAAVPEPSTWAMILFGFVGVGWLACRRRWTTAVAPLTTLDELAAANGVGPVDFLKVDIEGGEFRMFLGAREFLSSSRALVIMFECEEDWSSRSGGSLGFKLFAWGARSRRWTESPEALSKTGTLWAARDQSSLPLPASN